MIPRILFLIGLLFTSIVSFAQNEIDPQIDFRPPIDGQLYLAGTFGELRSNHFHAGIDIKTGGAEGRKVYAIEDGYVSRIKVSTGGYGKVIYITHPNGYVSVYGHLQKFMGKLQKYIYHLQYKRERFVVESFPKKGELVVKKGEVIALSGNTGGSTAPHLHFEIREEASQHPVNPLLFKSIAVKDFYRPKILELGIYPVDENSLINGKHDTVFYSVSGWGEEHYLTSKPTITVSGNVSFGLRTYDAMNDIANKNGIYKVEFYLDSTKYFGLEMNKLSFATTRYLNSLIDYNYYKLKKRRLIRTQVDTNNRLMNYCDVRSNGIIHFADSTVHTIKYVVSDAYENVSKLQFKVKSEPTDIEKEKTLKPNGVYFDYKKENKFSKDYISLSFPANAFYQSFYFQFESKAGDSTMFSSVYKIHNIYTPIQKAYRFSITPTAFPQKIKEKLYIAYIADNGGNWFIGSKWKDGKLSAKSKLFGQYAVLVDTVSPEITPVNIGEGKNISAQKTIKVKIRDRKTGIKQYRGTLNGEWILMEYESKKRLLFYQFDDKLLKGKNEFKLVVSDLLGNETVYEAELIY